MRVTKKDIFMGLPLPAAISLFMQGQDMTLLNTAVRAIAADLQRSPFSLQMIINGYALTSALLIPLRGWIGDRYGTRRFFISALLIYLPDPFSEQFPPIFIFLFLPGFFREQEHS